MIPKQKYFIITVDTEGDNLWAYHKGDEVTTQNALYIPRFQELCEQYGFKPVYLTNYEMAKTNDLIQYIKPKAEKGLCEIGIHVHAWNNPPLYDLNGQYGGNPYLIEYPYEVMREKFKVTYDLIAENFGIKPVSHRAGRWAMNADYFKLLKEFDVKVDCSYTPLTSWAHCPGETIPSGSDYSNESLYPTLIDGILEVPFSSRKNCIAVNGSFKHRVKVLLEGELIELRPASNTLAQMKKMCKIVARDSKADCIEFMIHSSELMPGGSPYFKDEQSVNRLFETMTGLFDAASQMGYTGVTLDEYYNNKA